MFTDTLWFWLAGGKENAHKNRKSYDISDISCFEVLDVLF
jgi:hypothetical protein